jgi:hypothetical protein
VVAPPPAPARRGPAPAPYSPVAPASRRLVARRAEPAPTVAPADADADEAPNQLSAPIPTSDGFMSTEAKMSLADVALALRDEQLEAKVVTYKGELATNPELDAVTAQVIQELQSLQAAGRAAAQAAARPAAESDRAQLEIELIQSLKEMLGRIFRHGKLATILERKLGEVSKRFARTFFRSELHDKIRGSDTETKAMRFPEQALFHAFGHVQDALVDRLESYSYASAPVKERALDHLYAMIKELRQDFLARTTPELNVLVKYLNEVLTHFFVQELPPLLGELAWEVVKEARLADANMYAGYKISAQSFPIFRQAFERRFLQRLVPFVEDAMLERVREHAKSFRAETIRLVADPTIFSDTCEIVCEAVYDMLYNDGFLDLPSDWRARLSAEQ